MTRPPPTDLIVVACLSVATLSAAFLGLNMPVLRATLAAPLVFVLPGYALMKALLPDQPRRLAEQLLLSLGSSLAVAVLGGLILNLTPWGIRAESWAGLLCSVTLAACVVAAMRARAALSYPAEPMRLSLRPLQAMLVAVAVLLVFGTVWVARTPAPQQSTQTYSLLWAVPASDSGSDGVRLGVESGESDTSAFIVRVVEGTQQLEEFPIQLAPAQRWETELTLTGAVVVGLEVQLSKTETPDVVYRRVALRPAE